MIALAVGGTEDHVHLLFHLPPKLALAKAVLLLKSNSSKWMGEQGRENPHGGSDQASFQVIEGTGLVVLPE